MSLYPFEGPAEDRPGYLESYPYDESPGDSADDPDSAPDPDLEVEIELEDSGLDEAPDEDPDDGYERALDKELEGREPRYDYARDDFAFDAERERRLK